MPTSYTIGAFAIIFDTKQHVLLCHRRDIDMWNLPGGGLKKQELPTEAAERETLEETGLLIDIKHLVGVYRKSAKNDLTFIFLAKVTGGKIGPTDEADEIAYFAIDKIPHNTTPGQVECIHDALKQEKHPIFRRQTTPSARRWLRMLTKRKKKKKRKSLI
ncbi:MAG: NUDIX hydrolase [Anaerolineae bacterium]|nr:NUDIX hydrolase [Anaerolineae bacterium]